MTTFTREAQLLLQSFLRTIPVFSALETSTLDLVIQKLQPIRYSSGQTLLGRGQLPSHVAIVYEGQVQLLGVDPQTQRQVSLELLEPGAMIGWLGLVRGIPCETVIAAGSGVCLAWAASDFLSTLKAHPQLEAAFKQECPLIEAFELMSVLKPQIHSNQSLTLLARQTYLQARVKYLKPGRYKTAVLDPAWVWVVSGGAPTNSPIGKILEISHQETTKLHIVGPQSARLIGFPKHLFQDPAIRVDQVFEQVSTQTHNETERAAKPILADTSELEPNIEPSLQHSFPWVRANQPVDCFLACFQMLGQYYEIPFRRDTIRRVIHDRMQRDQSISLEFCGGLVELMGLRAQLLRVSQRSITKLDYPALVFWHNQLAVVYTATEKEIILALPKHGLKRITLSELVPESDDRISILLAQKTAESPQKRFGLSWFIPSLMKYAPTLITVLVASFFVQLFSLANPLIVQVIIDKVLSQNSPDTLTVLGILLLGMALAESVLGALRTYALVDTTNRIDLALGSEIINHLFRLPLRYFERRPVGELASRINELENIRKFLTGTALTVVLDIIFSAVYLIVMVIYSGLLTLVALATVPVFGMLTLIVSPLMRRQLRVKAEKNAQTQSYLVEVLSGIQTVKAQNIELRAKWQWQERYARYVSAGFNTVLTSTISGAMSNSLNKISNLMLLWLGSYLVLQGELTLGQLIAFRIIAGYATNPLLRLVQLWQNFQETVLSLERLSDILDTPVESELIEQHHIPMPPIKGKVIYENVSFRFKAGGPLQLDQVSQVFPLGAFIGIIGQSGSGKSTLMKLLPRLYLPESGRILIDGYDITKVELYSLRRQIGIVLQDPLLFEGTVQDNIMLAHQDASAEEVVEAAKIAVAHEFIMNLPNGYATRLGERGAGLSGGQRQRIAIARMILQNPQIVVLDEATSALDYDTERRVCLNLTEHFRGRTLFFITHRLTTIKHADLIVVMDQGAIVEHGSHEDLLAQTGRYFNWYQSSL